LPSVKTFSTLFLVEPVGLIEIAERLGVKRATVDMWKLRGLLPPAKWTVGGRPAWDWADIMAWAKETGRLTDSAGSTWPDTHPV
jgi:predicted DNA-binding transcriptional regulator AlpA